VTSIAPIVDVLRPGLEWFQPFPRGVGIPQRHVTAGCFQIDRHRSRDDRILTPGQDASDHDADHDKHQTENRGLPRGLG
jgi:hypothetical protein